MSKWRYRKSTTAQDLVVQTQPDRNWRGTLIALLVICLIFVFIFFAIFVLDPEKGSSSVGANRQVDDRTHIVNRLNLESLYQFQLPHFEHNWRGDILLSRDTAGNVFSFDPYEPKTHKIVFPAAALSRVGKPQLSSDGEYALQAVRTRKKFRYSGENVYIIRNRAGEEFKLLETPTTANVGSRNAFVRNVQWSPTGHKLVFVYKNDVYVKQQPDKPATRITVNGVEGLVYNGIADWVYEEEVFEASNAIWWSPDSRFVAFASFDDTEVRNYSLITYGNTSSSWCCDELQYPQLRTLKYPKPGTPNPKASLTVIDTSRGYVSVVMRPSYSSLRESESSNIICQVKWASNEHLYVQWLNRDQNSLEAFLFDVVAKSKYSNFKYIEENGWLTGHAKPLFPSDLAEKYFFILPDSRSAARRNQIVLLTARALDMQQSATYLTNSSNHVVDIYGYFSGYLYFSGTGGVSRQQHIYRLKLANGSKVVQEECLTCGMPDGCGYNEADFSKSGKIYIRRCLGSRIPFVEIRESETNNLVYTILDGETLQRVVDKYNTSSSMYLSVPMHNSSGFSWEAQVELILPPMYNNTPGYKFPLLISVYAGPESNGVDEKFSVGFDNYIASAKDIVVAKIDGRGSGRQGAQLAFQVYKHLGRYEVLDQLNVAKYLIRKFSFLDPNKVGIWGWSYGGYVAAKAVLLDDDSLVKCSASVAPVTDWMFYDSVYTERYMRMPRESSITDRLRYEAASIVNSPSEILRRIGSVDYLLMHGTADDNVHFLHTAQLMKVLQRESIPFDMFVFPDQAHSIAHSHNMVYQKLTHHFTMCFDNINNNQAKESDQPMSKKNKYFKQRRQRWVK